ncbi:MAG: cytochrome c1 [Novosphingobium sp.]
MIRIFSLAVGAFFSLALLLAFGTGAYSYITEPPAKTAEKLYHKHPKALSLPSDGIFGRFDEAQLQRGYAVYSNVCAACHSLSQVAYRDLAAIGYNEAEIKAIAAKATINAKDPLTGELKDRPGLPSDKFPPVVYAGKGAPPDLSLITKARHKGPAYVYSLLTGYEDQPAALVKQFPDAKTPDGMHYNPYFAALNIAMANPLASDGLVTYSDGTEATREQMAKDVAAFLVWTAEPELEQRHQTGLMWIGFLLFATALAYMSYRNIWADKKGH